MHVCIQRDFFKNDPCKMKSYDISIAKHAIRMQDQMK